MVDFLLSRLRLSVQVAPDTDGEASELLEDIDDDIDDAAIVDDDVVVDADDGKEPPEEGGGDSVEDDVISSDPRTGLWTTGVT